MFQSNSSYLINKDSSSESLEYLCPQNSLHTMQTKGIKMEYKEKVGDTMLETSTQQTQHENYIPTLTLMIQKSLAEGIAKSMVFNAIVELQEEIAPESQIKTT